MALIKPPRIVSWERRTSCCVLIVLLIFFRSGSLYFAAVDDYSMKSECIIHITENYRLLQTKSVNNQSILLMFDVTTFEKLKTRNQYPAVANRIRS